MVTALALIGRWPIGTLQSLSARATFLASRFDDTVARSDGSLRAIRTKSDLDRLVRDRESGRRVVGLLLAAEGLHPLEGDAEELEEMFHAGYRMLGLAHFFDNEIAGSAHGEQKGGLTPLGERVVDRMQALGVAIDLAHASARTIDDVLDRARVPIVVSHTGVQATCPGPRNLSDAQLRRIATGGGVVGIALFSAAVCDTRPEAVARAMRHVADLVGVAHVGLGSDWNGATEVEIDAGRLVRLTDALLRDGFADDEVRAILGGNALRVLRATLPN
jgi:microsomal dipeptidase-like Zn-dependent dipeptidase